MGYSAQVMSRARERLARAKAEKESVYQQHLHTAYTQVPRIKEIDILLRRSMALAAQAVFSKGGDPKAAMEQVKQANLALQSERRQLLLENFPPKFLDETPVCENCGGSGYVGSTMCRCLQELCRQEQKKELTLLNVGTAGFEDFRLDYYSEKIDPKYGRSIRSIMERTYEICRRYAQEFSETSGNLLFSGDTGLGKTFLSACIAAQVAQKGYGVVYESAVHLFSKMEKARFSGDEQAQQECRKYTACDLLIVDDLGTEMPGTFVNSALYTLINDRILSGKPTIISTNLGNEELISRYSAQIVSRLRGNYQRVAFVGEDIRVMKNRGF